MYRIFVYGISPGVPEVTVTGEDARHLLRAARLRRGDRVTVCDGAGTDYECELVSAARDAAVFRVVGRSASEGEGGADVTLYQAVARDQMDDAVRHAVELGVRRIVPVITARTERTRDQAERWRRIAYSAACQSGRGIVPAVENITRFSDIAPERFARMIFAYENERGSRIPDAAKRLGSGGINLMIGPEGGFSPEEAEEARLRGAALVTLGPRILRVETAVCAALALINDALERNNGNE
ncbi:MAG: 16S rRNA (uracil(1498)-N(3))-methyltransferase [Clostridiales bacterium]|jgi:16S rRNA (uracil1498-N3)-methyltransferase|nr:16S rRNA (uracil(1498)-N(3))-methyltransferase [Clostridiales bacterium]